MFSMYLRKQQPCKHFFVSIVLCYYLKQVNDSWTFGVCEELTGNFWDSETGRFRWFYKYGLIVIDLIKSETDIQKIEIHKNRLFRFLKMKGQKKG